MSTRPAMTLRTIEPAQRTAAKVVGFLYLLMMVTGMFAELYARGHLIVPGDALQTARNIASSERLFRLGTVSNLVTFAGDVLLIWALYVVLEPINRNVALLAAFWRLAECAILAVILLTDFVALGLLGGADYSRAFGTGQSRYIPRALAGWGIFSSLVVAIVTLAILVFPSLAAVVGLVYFGPIFIFEVTMGFWLLIKGIQAPIVE